MIKIYVDQIKNKESTTVDQSVKCDRCLYVATKNTEGISHKQTCYSVNNDQPSQEPSTDEEGIVYCCNICKFDTKTEKNFTDHIKKT